MTEAIIHESIIWQYISGSGQNPMKRTVLEALDGIAKCGNESSVFAVTALCLDKTAGIREKAWTVLNQLLVEVSPEKLARLDVLMRRYRVIVQPLNRIYEVSVPTNVLGMLSFSFDGYVREAAVRQLADRFDGDELPFILLRVNDWVDAIHRLAVDAIEARLSLRYSGSFVQCIPLLRRLWIARRYQHDPLRMLIERNLALPDNLDMLLGQLNSRDRRISRYVFELLTSRLPASGSQSVIDSGLSHDDPLIRLRAVEAAFKHFSREGINELVPRLLGDCFAPIRKETLRWAANNDWNGWRECMRDSFFDRNGGVREFARYCLPEVDAASLYLAKLEAGGSRMEPTLRGVLETKVSVSDRVIEPFLSSAQAGVRAAAYAILFAIGSKDLPRLIPQALSDGSGRCAKEASNYLARNPSGVPGDLLWELMAMPLSIRARMAIIIAISKLNKWESLLYLLKAKALAESKLQETVDREIDEWIHAYNRSFVPPNTKQLQVCREVFLENGELLRAAQRQELGFILKQS